jgi:hypothetical protein
MRKALFTAVALGAMTVGSGAFAAVVCNQEGDCWKVKDSRAYKPDLKLKVYPDNWRWADRDAPRYRWRDPGHGHGYYRNGVWLEIR